jgi:hypothetical protein
MINSWKQKPFFLGASAQIGSMKSASIFFSYFWDPSLFFPDWTPVVLRSSPVGLNFFLNRSLRTIKRVRDPLLRSSRTYIAIFLMPWSLRLFLSKGVHVWFFGVLMASAYFSFPQCRVWYIRAQGRRQGRR